VKPLAGVRILDLTRHMAGPCATQMLSDYGAEVIKIESLPYGDPSRRTGTVFKDDQSGLFLVWNRGKKSVAVDLRKAEGIGLVCRLAATADVLIENFRPGIAHGMGLGYEKLAKENERLVYVSLSAFGSEGPWRDDPGTDPVVQAMSGVMSVTGEPEGGPLLVGVPIADFTGALFAAHAILLGLLARQQTGRGQKIEISMLSALMASLTTRLASYWFGGEIPSRHGGKHSVVAPYQVFKTADGWVVAGAWGSEDGWGRFCEAIGRPDLEKHPDFEVNTKRVENREALEAILDPIFASRTTEHWRQRFHEARALFGPVHTVPQALEQDQAAANSFVGVVEHVSLGGIPQLLPVVRLHDTPGAIAGPPPLLGQHTTDVLADLGLDADDIVKLEEAGVVSTARSAR
jgi:crotonobetainyl-CoA:carnitine CoA-transferase CaiB-like acyl-CoA transferase